MVAGTRGCVANAEYNEEAVLQPHSAGANITGQLPNQTHQDKPIVALSQLLSDHISQSWYVS
jgi:hypothetical protein